ncbi:dihydrodipicolinate synthase family protein [Microbacterium ulmi]|uniref:Dihydrodipicolinate synthase family protein n=1 Tax=Microbacterium ulmi TaxID=179095 RepID=A0A7Y2M0Q7_9MICO|nr:dihydrodipicolinate synthase family protein [Microbacterium ulmi]NII68683.1 4-hydroxy-tetrahydrodipicolinate synthase [Microbacterium ulmi]NNH03654.1 dihydrodipicolinate synthase family protein [Microbacterium ulmi]
MRSNLTLRGTYPAPSVPFTDDYSIDEAEFAGLLTGIAAVDGVEGVVVNGHAGELTTLTARERARVITIAREILPAGKIVISGVEDFSIAGSIDKLNAAKDAGADAALVLPTFDYLPRRALTQSPEAPLRYFDAIAAGTDLPFVIFEYPKSTGISYTTETLLRLTEIDNVVAIKDTVSDDQDYQEHLEVVRPRVPLLTAIDSPGLLGLMLLGSDGIILGASQLAPASWAEYVGDVLSGRVEDAIDVFTTRLLPILTHIYSSRFATPASANSRIKEALVQTGVISSSRVRPPELDVTDVDRAAIRTGLERAGLVPAVVS